FVRGITIKVSSHRLVRGKSEGEPRGFQGTVGPISRRPLIEMESSGTEDADFVFPVAVPIAGNRQIAGKPELNAEFQRSMVAPTAWPFVEIEPSLAEDADVIDFVAVPVTNDGDVTAWVTERHAWKFIHVVGPPTWVAHIEHENP